MKIDAMRCYAVAYGCAAACCMLHAAVTYRQTTINAFLMGKSVISTKEVQLKNTTSCQPLMSHG